MPDPSRAFAVFGLQGVARHWFEVDLAAFLSDDGDLSAWLETEYDLLITRKVVLQPRFEIQFAASQVPDAAIGRGISQTDIGLRLRYEMHRRFAPYVGVSWTRYWADTADLRRAAAQDNAAWTVSAGLRFWF